MCRPDSVPGNGGWSEKRRGSWWDTRAPRLRLSGRHALRVCGEVVRRGVVLWLLGSRAQAREGENEGECMEELLRRDESETCRHISGVRTVCGRAQDG